MKTNSLILLIGILFCLSSCAITENLIINEDGSGKFAYDIDMSELIALAGEVGQQEESSSKNKKSKKDKKGKEAVNEKIMDSTFSFKSLLAEKSDSISKLPLEEQKRLKMLERFSMRMVVNEPEKIMTYSMFTDFSSVNELQEIMSPMNSMKSLGGNNKLAGSLSEMKEDDSSTRFYYDGKKFTKTVTATNLKETLLNELKNEENDLEDSEELSEESLSESFSMIYEQSSFKMVYQFPKPVKRVSIENAQFSADRKTITVEYPMETYMEKPESMSFEIDFE
ncbi:hypothetical protein [Flavobacterium orientale]|uniref:Lipoprotein n=1 Tax=Flavobacterium orientale TaxID=1756020 RepID=A0A917D8D1_9FLAO|nr:hypothetical protein [Flavobacterium orientale]GGD14513.1 hypothetical protein GCM10011343_01970 [Flavobacterium orientale]